jgi:hypothetical protein
VLRFVGGGGGGGGRRRRRKEEEEEEEEEEEVEAEEIQRRSCLFSIPPPCRVVLERQLAVSLLDLAVARAPPSGAYTRPRFGWT